jgi:hypothetical protein
MANTNKQSTQARGERLNKKRAPKFKLEAQKLRQTPINKAPSKGGRMEQRERTQVQARRTKPKVGHNGGMGTNHI